MNGLISEDYLMHYGVKGMKWKVRKGIQNEIEGIKRFASTQQNPKNGSYQTVYNTSGKGYTKYKVKKGSQKGVYTIAKKGKSGKTAKIERGMLAVYRMLHPGE